MGSVFCGLSNQVTFRRLSAVDRYIIAVRRCYRSKRRMLLTVYTSYFVVYAVMDFSSFVHAAFGFAALCYAFGYVRSVFGLLAFFLFM